MVSFSSAHGGGLPSGAETYKIGAREKLNDVIDVLLASTTYELESISRTVA